MKSARFLIFSILLLSPLFVFAQVSNIAFTTEPQVVKPNVISEPITIQAQDGAGNSTQTSETLDLTFESSSATGEFVNASGAEASKTMNKNTANRTFYYRDSISGNFTLKVSAQGRESGLSWSSTQPINISSSGAGQVLGASSNSSTQIITQSSNISSSNNSSQTPTNPSLEVVAGIDRLTTAGSPIAFQASVKKGGTNSRIAFSWSFGDGHVGSGADVTHVYKYPGTYVVVLNARLGDLNALSRLVVNVTEPQLGIKIKDEVVEISNNGDREINLFNWKLSGGLKGFIFQPDTIILPHSSVTFDNSLLKLEPIKNQGLVLQDNISRSIASASVFPQNTQNTLAQNDLDAVSQSLSLIQEEALSIQSKILAMETPEVHEEVATEGAVLGASTSSVSKFPEINQELEIVYEVPETPGIFGRLTNFIKKVFSK